MAKTLQDIRRDMLKYKDPTNFPTNLTIRNMNTLPSVGTNSLTFQSLVKSEKSSRNHVTSIQFLDVQFAESEQEGFRRILNTDGKILYYSKASARENRVKLKCSCESFRFEGEWQLFQAQSLIGNWRRYTRKTPPKIRPANPSNPNPDGKDFVNPNNNLFMCKHIYNLLLSLKKRDFITN